MSDVIVVYAQFSESFIHNIFAHISDCLHGAYIPME